MNRISVFFLAERGVGFAPVVKARNPVLVETRSDGAMHFTSDDRDFYFLYVKGFELEHRKYDWVRWCKGYLGENADRLDEVGFIGHHFVQYLTHPVYPAGAILPKSGTRMYSDRDHPLLHGPIDEDIVVTLEDYSKWYDMYFIVPAAGEVPTYAIPMHNYQGELKYDPCATGLHIDHNYHPECLLRVAMELGGYAYATALEVAMGRWVMEGHSPEAGDGWYFLDDEE